VAFQEALKLLRFGTSGVRGVVGQTFTPGLVVDLAESFATYLDGGTVLVGRDTRWSSPMVRSAVVAALMGAGCSVLDLGVCPAPILQFLVRRRSAAGAISVSGGHNDADWNAITFINADGIHLNVHEGEEVLDIYHSGERRRAPWDSLGSLEGLDNYRAEYFDALCALLDADLIRRAGFGVIVDPCNGAGAGIVDEFFDRLGCRLVPINNEPNGVFPHDPEPRPRNARQVASVIKPVGGDIGFLLNSDVTRVSIISEVGETVTEEYTFPLVADYVLGRTPGTVVSNLSTTRTLDDVAARHGCRLVKTLIGQSHSIAAMLNEEAVIAGEGSGGVAVAAFQPAFDAFLTMGLMLEKMARTGRKASELVDDLPRYHIRKRKIYCPSHRVYAAVDEVHAHYAELSADTTDGIRVEWPDGWLHIRASATEPLVRVIAEATSDETAQERVDHAADIISQAI
jgi:phosphomannomutase